MNPPATPAPITDAHRQLVHELGPIFARAAEARAPFAPIIEGAQLIANFERDVLARDFRELREGFTKQRKNYIELCEAVTGDGSLVGAPDPMATAKEHRAEIESLRKAIEELYKQAHAAISFSDSNEFSMDMEVSAAISMLKQRGDELAATNETLLNQLTAMTIAVGNLHVKSHQAVVFSEPSGMSVYDSIEHALALLKHECRHLAEQLAVARAVVHEADMKALERLGNPFTDPSREQLLALVNELGEDLECYARGVPWSTLCAAPGEPAVLAYRRFKAAQASQSNSIPGDPAPS